MATSISPDQPIPNGPFSYPETWYLQGPTGPLITGNGLCITAAGIICATGGGSGGGGVTSIVAGAGLTGGTITTTGTIALQTTGVIPGLYQRANVTVDPYGRITGISSNPAPGTVCSITAGTGLSGGVITSTGTVAIASTGVTAGTYSFPTLTLNEQGQVLSASSCTAISVLGVTNGICVAGGGANPIVSGGTISLTNTGVTAGNYTVPSLTVDAQGRITAITSGSSGVSNIITGTGLTGGPITTTGTISLSNTGVTAGNYNPANITVDAQGRITAASNAAVVTCVATGTGLTGGPITSTGSIALAPLSPSSAGTYSFANLTVDSFGRVSTASSANLSVAVTGVAPISTSGNATSVAISVADGTTAQKGVVALTNDLVTNCATTALTAAQGYSLQQQVNALSTASNQTLAGTFDATTSQMLTVTSDGSSAGFTVGSNIPAPAAGNVDFFVIVTTGGSYNPPGGGGPYTTSQGDWFLSNGTAWQFLNVGYDENYATTTAAGTIQLATEAQVATGTDATLAVTPLTLRCNYVPSACYGTKGDLIVATGAGTYSALPVGTTDGAPLVACSTDPTGVAYGSLPILQNSLLAKGNVIVASGASTPDILPVGTNGQVLTACSDETLGVKWADLPAASIPCSQITAVGSLITGTAPGVPSTLASSNTNGDVLVVCTACSNGLAWCTPGSFILTCCVTAKGALISGTAANTPTALPVGADGQVLTACALCPTGLFWAAASVPAIPCDCITGKGALITGTSASNPSPLTVGTDGQVLTACAACPSGLFWAAASTPSIPCALLTAKGSLVSASGAGTPADFTVGANGQLLTANSACALGLEWVNSSYIPCSTLTAKGDILTATALGTPSVVNVGVNGQYLRVCCDCPSGLTWGTVTTAQDTPVGLISWFAATVAPPGWLVADGRAISRTTYSSLFAVIGTTYGAGDGSTTFNIPDMRGMFARGWDVAGGTARNCDPGRAFGSTQLSALGTHCHVVCASGGAAGVIEWACPDTTTPTRSYSSAFGPLTTRQAGFTNNSGGAETRPMNVAMLPCIKYEETLAPVHPEEGIPCACITGKGALLTGSAPSTPQALPAGVNGSVLVSCSGCALGMTWCSPVITATNAAVSYRVTAGNMASGNASVAIVPGVNGVAIVADLNTCGWLNVADGRFTPTLAGYYQVNAQVSATTSTGNVWGGILCNGSIYGQALNSCTNLGNWNTTSYSAVVYMNGTTDYLQMGASYQNGTPTFACQTGLTRFSATLVGAVTTLPATYQISQFPSFTSAGTIQSVGINAVSVPSGAPGTAPTITASTQNNISYRQIGPKEWEVRGVLHFSNGTPGSGDYVLTLPAGLQFDLGPYQLPYTSFPNEDIGWLTYGLINAWAAFGQGGAATYNQSYIVPYDATRYRIFPNGPAAAFWGSGYYNMAAYNGFRKWGFTFLST